MKRLLLSLALSAGLLLPAQADQTINQLSAGSALTGTEQIPMYQGANPATTTTPSAIKTYIAPVTSVATSCGVTGGTITSTGTISGAAQDNPQTGTTYTIQSTDCGLVDRFTNASAVTITVPTPTGFASNFFVTLKCESAGGCSTSGTVDGSASAITIAQGNSIDLYVDGSSAWHKLPGNAAGGGGTPGGSSGNLQTNNGSGGFGAYAGVSGVAHQWISALTASGVATQSQPGFSDLSGAATYGQLPAGQVNHPGYQASVWYPLLINAHANGATAMSATTAYCGIAQIGGSTTVHPSNLGVQITTLGTTNISLALYANDFTSGIARPGVLIANTGSQVDTATGFFSVALSNIVTAAVPPGFYWQCVQAGDTTVRIAIHQSGTLPNMFYTGSATLTNAMGSGNIDDVSTTTGITSFGTWPASMVGSTFTETAGNAPYLAVEFSSVP